MEFLIFLCLSLSAKTLPQTALPNYLKSWQKSWDATHTLKANFKQTVFSKQLGTNDEVSGVLFISKPGKLRWESSESTQILNENKFIILRENKRRETRTVDIYENIGAKVDAKALGFLSGTTPFKEVYHAKLIKETPEIIELRLNPKKKKNESYIAEISKKGYELNTLVFETPESTVTLSISNSETNPVIDGKLFEYNANSKDIVHKQ